MPNINKDFIELLNKIQKTKEADIQQYFEEVAEYLFNHMAIKAGDKEFTFAEIEFYFYKENEFEGPLYNCTYPRTRNAGQFFWHYSGLDICFESKEEKRYFGGILIRSLMKDGEIIAGPMRCSDEIMNSCEECMPFLIDYETHVGKPKSAIRYGIDADKNDNESNIEFCYYIPGIEWTRPRGKVLVADKTTGGYKEKSKTDYYSAQPDKRNN